MSFVKQHFVPKPPHSQVEPLPANGLVLLLLEPIGHPERYFSFDFFHNIIHFFFHLYFILILFLHTWNFLAPTLFHLDAGCNFINADGKIVGHICNFFVLSFRFRPQSIQELSVRHSKHSEVLISILL